MASISKSGEQDFERIGNINLFKRLIHQLFSNQWYPFQNSLLIEYIFFVPVKSALLKEMLETFL